MLIITQQHKTDLIIPNIVIIKLLYNCVFRIVQSSCLGNSKLREMRRIIYNICKQHVKETKKVYEIKSIKSIMNDKINP